MNIHFAAAAVLLLAIGAAHSWLGEKYILIPLFRSATLPRLFGGQEFTRRTLRFAWHLTTVAWWGTAALLLVMSRAQPGGSLVSLSTVIAVTLLACAVTSFVGSRGRHLSWVVFLAAALLVWAGAA